MEKCVHVSKVLTAKKNGEKVHFLSISPVLDSVLSQYITTNPDDRATMLGWKQVETMLKKDKAVEGTTQNGDNMIVGNIFRKEDSNLSDKQVRNVVSRNMGGADLSPVKIKEGVPGKGGNVSCVSVAGTICLSYKVRRGYTTFYVNGKDTSFGGDFHRKYVVVNWGDNRSSQLVVLDVNSGEFVDIVSDTGAFGAHVESAYKVSMDENMEIKIHGSNLVEKTMFVAEDDEEDVDVENLTADPANVAGMDLAIVPQEPGSYDNLLREDRKETVEGEGMAALAAARDKGFLKKGGTVMMPEHEETVAAVQLESLFD